MCAFQVCVQQVSKSKVIWVYRMDTKNAHKREFMYYVFCKFINNVREGMKQILIIVGCSLCLAQPCRAMEGDSALLKELRQRFNQPQDVNSPDGYAQGQPFLHEVIERADNGALNFLLDQHHVAPDVQNDEGEYPLHIATRRRNQRMVELLLAKNANIDSQAVHGDTPLHMAARARQ